MRTDLPEIADQLLTHEARLRKEGWKQRAERLGRLRAAILSRRDAIIAALQADLGKPLVEIELSEFLPVLAEIDHARRHLRGWMKPRRVATPLWLSWTSGSVHTEPRGASLIIAPWNYPLTLTLCPLVSAVSAGCPVAIKPSEFAPRTAHEIGEIVEETFEPGAAAVVKGGADISRALTRLPFRHIHFTGSQDVAREVMKAAAERLASVTLELGGKSPALVHSSADLDLAARRIAVGKFCNAGQTCIAPDYVVVEERVRKEFVRRLAHHSASLFDESSGTAPMTRIVTQHHMDRLAALLSRAMQAGDRVVCGGRIVAETLSIEPAVVEIRDGNSPLMEGEIFGPILPVLGFTDLDVALAEIRNRPDPLTMYIFSGDETVTRHVLSHTRAGSACINDTLIQFLHPGLPFGGVGASGMGRTGGRAGYLSFSNERSILEPRTARSPLTLFYPPFTAGKERLARLFNRYF
jgi:aldehyde dehydrogenase (NAD+)